MRALRRTGAAVLAVTLTASLASCASETERYCGELAEQKGTLADLAVRSGEPGEDVLAETLEVWRGLRESAPGDVEDEWSTLVFALESLVEAFDSAGVSPGDFDPASPPAGVSEEEADHLQDAAAELASPRVTEAGEALQQHARDVCKVDLGLSTQGG